MGLLDGLFGNQRFGMSPGMMQSRGSGMSPLAMALVGALLYKKMQGRGNIADTLSSGRGGFGTGGFGGLFSGGALSGGLSDLLNRFHEKGYGDKAETWVKTGPNKPISPPELEDALGAERIEWLQQQTGMSKEELLKGLSQELPHTVDKLTPEGRIPDEQEAQRLLQNPGSVN